VAGNSSANLPFINVGNDGFSDTRVWGTSFPLWVVSGWGDSNLSLPLITALGAAGGGTSSVTLPSIVAGIPSSAELPLITASSTGVTGSITNPYETTHNIPLITGVGTGDPGGLGISVANLPPIYAAGETPGVSENAIPAVVASSTGAAGQIGASSATLQALQAASAGVSVSNGVSAATLAQLVAAGTAIYGGVGVSNATLARIIVAAQGHTGSIGTSTVTLPIYDASGTGYGPSLGTSTVVLPLIIAQSTGIEPAATVYHTVAMHTETMAVTTYSNYPFNSFAAFNGIYLAAGDAGLFALTGATDDGVFIDAAMRVGITDFGDSHLKRVPRMYIGYRTDGDLILRVITDEAHTRDYPLRSTGVSGIHGAHVKIGKGVNARYWQFEIRNVDGADFELSAIEAKPILTARRIGGRDA